MSEDFTHKSSPEQIRARFDADVERFSDLVTGQAAAIGSAEHLELVTRAAAACTPGASSVLDIGCGAGNYTIKLLRTIAAAREVSPPPEVSVTLLDLSRPMLERAVRRVAAETTGRIETVHADVRDARLAEAGFDIVLAAQCLHHLRGEDEWVAVFEMLRRCLRRGGGLWISDSVEHQQEPVRALMRQRWGEYLANLKGPAYRDEVLAYADIEDSPRPLAWQVDLLRRVGFDAVEILHVDNRFAAFGALRDV